MPPHPGFQSQKLLALGLDLDLDHQPRLDLVRPLEPVVEEPNQGSHYRHYQDPMKG
ncbi:hypothetical protein HanIR_Chr17g0860691 [Helianthus annuus]|nr:hypothetical protein HanIR_Chr17g0860691 [Helianthus annuus]